MNNFLRYAVVFVCIVGCFQACKTTAPNSSLQDSGTPYLEALTSKEDYLRLVATNTEGFTHIKFTYDLTGGEKVYFQNTAQYDFHLPFLIANVPAYAGLNAQIFEELIFMPLPKDLAAGGIFYSESINIPGSSVTGTMGFTVYQSTVDLDEIERVFKRFRAAIPFAADKLAFLFENPQHYFQYKLKLKQREIPSMLASSFAGQGDRPRTYNAALSYGYLRKVSVQQIEAGEYTPRDILVLDELPIDIGPTSGIISAATQTPASHVVLRAVNQKIPDIYVPNAGAYPSVAQNINKLVQLNVTADGQFTIKGEAAFAAGELQTKAEQYFRDRVPVLPELQADLSNNSFFSFSNGSPGPQLVKSYGAKGSNFAILDKALGQGGIDRSKFRGSFLIPFSYFVRHTTQALTTDICKKAKKECQEDFATGCEKPAGDCNGMAGQTAQVFLEKMVTEEHVAKMLSDPPYRKGYLGFARGLIQKMPARADDMRRINDAIKATYPAQSRTRMRFRSSTNAEDLPGLNGAGLYTSKGGCLLDNDTEDDETPSACLSQDETTRTRNLITKLENLDPVRYAAMIADLKDDLKKKRPTDKAIRKVMASLWNERAFLTRDYYRIPHLKVFMGILVHPSFADETANGVSVVKPHPSDPSALFMSVVTQIDDISITNPEIFGAVPDQLSLKYGADGQISEVLYGLHSNQIPAGSTILTESQIGDLAKQMAITYRALRAAYGETELNQTLDMEFKRGRGGVMEIKQARPL